MIPGIKVDMRRQAAGLHPGETVTEGLDGLRDRLDRVRRSWARASPSGARLPIGEAIPSAACQTANAHALARYAALARKPAWCRSSSPRC